MSKSVKFFITNYRDLHNKSCTPLRSKKDLIHLLLLVMKMINLGEALKDENKGICSIEIDKTSRVFITLNDSDGFEIKHYSFIFPFSLQKVDDIWSIQLKNSTDEITSEIIEFLIGLVEISWFNDDNENLQDLDSFACEFIDELGLNESIEKGQFLEAHLWSIIKVLFTFEPGYIRYDYDPTPGRVSEISHPLHHLDIYFSPAGTFKLGFDDSIRITDRLKLKSFKDILDNGKSRENLCYRLK
jgi:hypothetical protein